MAAGRLGKLGEAQNKVSGTTLAVPNTSGAIIPAGTTLYLALTFDNHASATAATVSLSNAGGAAWANGAGPIGSGITTSAGAGIWQRTFYVKTTAAIAVGATITTITFGSAVVGKAAVITGYSGVEATLRGNIVTGVSTAGTPSVVTAGTALVAGDIVIGAISGENSAVPTGDADSLNGSWSAIATVVTTGGGAANTHDAAGIQDKIVTATGAQTFNATTANDSVASVLALVPTPPPTAPTSAPTVAAGVDKVVVTTPATLQGNATSYKIYRGGVLVASGVAANTAVDDAAASVVATQTYTVRGTNAGGDSTDGPASSAVAANPGPPTGINLTPANTQVTVAWTVKSYTSTYKVYRDNVLVHTSAAGASSWVDTGLTNEVEYDYEVSTNVATPTVRESARSSVVSTTPSAATFVYPFADYSNLGWIGDNSEVDDLWSLIDDPFGSEDSAYIRPISSTDTVRIQFPTSEIDTSKDITLMVGHRTGSFWVQLKFEDTVGEDSVTPLLFVNADLARLLTTSEKALLETAVSNSWPVFIYMEYGAGSPQVDYARLKMVDPDPGAGPTVTVWNGSAEVPATIEGVWNGSVVVPMASIEVT